MFASAVRITRLTYVLYPRPENYPKLRLGGT